MRVQVGDEVWYTTAFVQQLGCDGDLAGQLGVVEALMGDRYALVLWDGEETPRRLHTANIERRPARRTEEHPAAADGPEAPSEDPKEDPSNGWVDVERRGRAAPLRGALARRGGEP